MVSVRGSQDIQRELVEIKQNLTPAKEGDWGGKLIRQIKVGLEKLTHLFKTGKWESLQKREMGQIGEILSLLSKDITLLPGLKKTWEQKGAPNASKEKEGLKEFKQTLIEDLKVIKDSIALIEAKKGKGKYDQEGLNKINHEVDDLLRGLTKPERDQAKFEKRQHEKALKSRALPSKEHVEQREEAKIQGRLADPYSNIKRAERQRKEEGYSEEGIEAAGDLFEGAEKKAAKQDRDQTKFEKRQHEKTLKSKAITSSEYEDKKEVARREGRLADPLSNQKRAERRRKEEGYSEEGIGKAGKMFKTAERHVETQDAAIEARRAHKNANRTGKDTAGIAADTDYATKRADREMRKLEEKLSPSNRTFLHGRSLSSFMDNASKAIQSRKTALMKEYNDRLAQEGKAKESTFSAIKLAISDAFGKTNDEKIQKLNEKITILDQLEVALGDVPKNLEVEAFAQMATNLLRRIDEM